jgi:hypothetical protein
MSSLDVFFLSSPDSSSVCRHVVLLAFCLATFVILIYSSTPPLPLRAGPMPIISSPLLPASFMFNVIAIQFPTLRMCMSMFHSFPPKPRFDRHSLLISITPVVHVLFIGLVSTILVSYDTSHVPIFVTEPRTVNLRFTAYSPALPFPLDRRRSHRPSFVLPLSLSLSPKLTPPPYTIDHSYHPIPILRNVLLVRCVIAFAIQNSAHLLIYRIFRILPFRSRSSCISHPSITFACLHFLLRLRHPLQA